MADRLIERLQALGKLEDGWRDGSGLAPTSEAIDTAFPLAVAFKDDGPSLFPTDFGGLQFEGAGFEVQISSCGISHIHIAD